MTHASTHPPPASGAAPTVRAAATVNGLVVAPHGGRPVVDGVDLRIEQGQVVALVGPSGSGKSTTALTLLGHLRPGLERRAGQVRVGDVDPFATAPSRLRGRMVAYLGQDPASALNPVRRLEHQIAELVRRRHPQPDRREMADAVATLVHQVKLPTDPDFLRRYPHQISGGQAQRVALAMVLAARPRLLVLDEPSSGLDPVLTGALVKLLAEIFAAGDTAGLLVTHDVCVAAALADQVVALDRGQIVRTGAPAAMLRLGMTSAARPTDRAAEGAGDMRLVAEGLRASHGRTAVLQDVGLHIAAGRAVALVGASGSGKTTTARCLLGLHRTDAGTVSLDGVRLASDVRRRTRGQRRALQLVAQDAVGALNPRETVLAAITRPLRTHGGMGAVEATRAAAALLERVGLGAESSGRRPAALSGGERQRVNLARTLAADPKVLICDEPTASLDPDTAEGVIALLQDLRSRVGLAVVLISHDLSLVARLADRVSVLEEGRVVEHGATAEVLAHPSHPTTARLLATRLPAVWGGSTEVGGGREEPGGQRAGTSQGFSA